MIYHLLYPYIKSNHMANLLSYITVRSFLCFILASIISIGLGKVFIRFIISKQFGQFIRADGPEAHFKKAGTPTMGGILIIGVVVSMMALFGNFFSYPVLATLFVTLSYFCLGLMDDYLKVVKKNSDGVSAKGKLFWQFATAAIVSWGLIHYKVIDTQVYLPFLKSPVIDLGMGGYILFASFVIVGSSNAVNLTDGLDGLAIGPIITSVATLGTLAYLAGHAEHSEYLKIPFVRNAGELAVLSAAVIGAGVGFLWYNSYPAQIFMGDVGSLSLGGCLGMFAVLTKNEFLFAVIGGIFVLEAVSVILQVGSYKLRKKRIFRMAPIHHHFELKGWPETKVIVRFWIISALLAILALATLKIR